MGATEEGTQILHLTLQSAITPGRIGEPYVVPDTENMSALYKDLGRSAITPAAQVASAGQHRAAMIFDSKKSGKQIIVPSLWSFLFTLDLSLQWTPEVDALMSPTSLLILPGTRGPFFLASIQTFSFYDILSTT